MPRKEPGGVLVLEMVVVADSNPAGRYERLALGCANDDHWASLERLSKQRLTQVSTPAWKSLDKYLADAASAGTVGKFGHMVSAFSVIVVSYYDGRRWSFSEYREAAEGPSRMQFRRIL